MIKGIYLNEMTDDCSIAKNIQMEIFGETACDNNVTDNEMPAVYILLCEEDGTPAGSARMYFSMDGIFRFDRLCVCEDKRNNGYADFIMHMIFDKCRLSGGNFLYSDDVEHNKEYFEKYGFDINDKSMILNVNEYYNNHKCKEH